MSSTSEVPKLADPLWASRKSAEVANCGSSNRCAIADFDQVIKLDPKFALSYYDRGVAYSRKANYDRAIADFDLAIQLNPKLRSPTATPRQYLRK
jgi:tetratricopeptide (TPR) repeat protein